MALVCLRATRSHVFTTACGSYLKQRCAYTTPASFHHHEVNHRTVIIDGVKIAQDIQDEVKHEIERLLAEGCRRPNLVAILVGNDPASTTYVRNKIKAAKYTGIMSHSLHLAGSITQADLLEHITELNVNPAVDGILVQLPLPRHISERAVCNAVAPEKDVDGFHIVNVGRLCSDLNSLLPATPAGVMQLLRRSGIKTFGKNAVVCGRSKNVGMPMAMLLHADGIGETKAGDATVTICHRYTPPEQLRHFTSMADIIISATGVPKLITGDMIKEGAALIDVGITRVRCDKSGKTRLVGDIDFNSCVEKAGFITPVPGGVGPMTVAMLMKNTLLAFKKEVSYRF